MNKMEDFLAATSGIKLSDAKSSIMEELKRMRQWQDSQRQEFQKKQIMEHRNSLLQSEKNLEQYYGNNKENMEIFSGLSVSSATDQSQSGSEVCFQNRTSSINGHMLNCFSDSSHDSTTLYGNKNKAGSSVELTSNGGYSSLSDISLQNPHLKENYMNGEHGAALPKETAFKRPVRPFLRKRTGLERYKPKKRISTNEVSKCSVEKKTDISQAKVILKLKPALHSSTSPPRKTNHVKFSEPIQVFDDEITNPKQLFQQSNESSDSQNSQHVFEESESENFSATESQELEDKSNSSDISLSSESKELAEFEMLENCAQNSSFNSDSSVVQRVLNGTLQPLKNPPQKFPSHLENLNFYRPEKKPAENAVNFTKQKEFDARKQRLQDFISNIEPRIASLQKEVTNVERSSYEESDCDISERCSTPVEDTALPSDCDSSKNSSLNSIIFVPHSKTEKVQHNTVIENKNANNKIKYRIDGGYSNEKDDIVGCTKQNEDVNKGEIEKSKLREKMEELEKEIQNYQAERLHLDKITKDREECLKQLNKERDEFQKNKDTEMNKFYSEMESQKQQFKREKETFNRLKKATKDYRNRKEREDLSTLKQEVEKLQKELKKERIKFNNETRKLKSQLTAAEKERDNLKLHNMTLEDQIEDLVATLKVRIALEEKAQVKVQPKGRPKPGKRNNAFNSRKESSVNQDSLENSDNFKEAYVNVEQDNVGDSNITKPKVDFAPQFKENFQSSYLSDSSIGSSNEKHIEFHRSLDTDLNNKTTTGFNSGKPPYKETQYEDRIERIYDSGEVEIFLPSGTRKHCSADGKTTKVFYTNGDIKEIFPDRRTIYTYVNGAIEKCFPSGLVVTEFVNGQIQTQHPDGSKQVKFPDGSIDVTYSDGRQAIIDKDGTIVRVDLDGTKTIEFKNGVKEIHKDGYKTREYLDGSVKTIYSSGRQETRYANGRIKIKDQEGNLVVDTKKLPG